MSEIVAFEEHSEFAYLAGRLPKSKRPAPGDNDRSPYIRFLLLRPETLLVDLWPFDPKRHHFGERAELAEINSTSRDDKTPRRLFCIFQPPSELPGCDVDADVADPYGNTLEARGLWGTFINQGAEKINGDAYLPKWDPRTWGSNDEYDPDTYYNYALEIPAGASGGELWIFDPVFCATSGSGRYGTGDR